VTFAENILQFVMFAARCFQFVTCCRAAFHMLMMSSGIGVVLLMLWLSARTRSSMV
jgi:hypothetical protein